MWCLERLLRDGHGLLPGRARRAKARSPAAACTNVLTPDRIPEFCIPPRIEPSLALTALRNSWGGAAEPDDGAHRTDWDPRSQAALSLPHLPRTRTAYGFCALLESPHTRRKESLLLGGPGAPPPAPRPRAHTDGGAAYASPTPRPAPAASTDAFLAPRPRGRRLLRVADGLLSRALRVRGAPRRARVRYVSSGDEDDVRAPDSPDPAPSPSPAEPRHERLQAEGTVALGRAGDALRLAAEYCPRRGRLRIRLLRTEGPGAAALEPRALGCRLSLVLRPPGAPARPSRGLVLARSRKASWERDCCFDGLSEEQLRRLAVRVHVHTESKGRALERRRPLGQGELPLGELLLL